MDLLRLREATAAEHKATEAYLPLMRADLTREQYANVLERFFAVISGWERWAEEHTPAPYLALVQHRKRAKLLARDLQSLERELPGPAFAADSRFLSPAGFLGAMYVVEGSTLGGQYIARHVEPLLDLNVEHGTAYFRGYGEATGARWQEFRQTIADLPEEDSDEVIAAARSMFALFREAFQPLSQKK